jgi:hypothetical protein
MAAVFSHGHRAEQSAAAEGKNSDDRDPFSPIRDQAAPRGVVPQEFSSGCFLHADRFVHDLVGGCHFGGDFKMKDKLYANSALSRSSSPAARMRFVAWLTSAFSLMFLLGCSRKQDVSMVQHAVDEFHQSLKAHEDGTVAVDLAPAFYQSVGVEARRAYLARIRSRLGSPLSSSPLNIHVDQLPAGTFLSARYQTRFENGDAQEDFSWQIENGRPYLVAYTAASPLLLGR